jgi:hypothetical protein
MYTCRVGGVLGLYVEHEQGVTPAALIIHGSRGCHPRFTGLFI